MKYAVLFAFFAVAASVSGPFDPELDEYWENFKKVFNKSYNQYEERARRLIWEEHVADIVRHNLRADLGIYSYRRGINKYSDLSQEEFSKFRYGYKGMKNSSISGSVWLPPTNVVLPDKVDWREKGYVSEVKDQGSCGSCWAFSSTGSLEGQNKKKTGKLISLSEQNLIDCSQEEGNDGCDGGWMDQAFDYVKKNKGIDTEKSYPYKAEDGKCHFKTSDIGGTCTGFVDIPVGNEDALKTAVATIGPISIAINAGINFESYESGIYDPPYCGGKLSDLDHGVLVVGYGSEGGKDYWLVKNSWGSTWGENGYIKMVRNKNNYCGIATKASYPLV